jgi:hypothetical protein
MSTKSTVDALYKDVAMYYNITVDELVYRLTQKGESLISKYWIEKWQLLE